ncbi:radical SAM domain protein [Aspergillus clavatus NRRL 1]|uniref:Radical SAM domain protein n=1 Tax=Aspergillus clavatus (strain ATCC 1007 / CBS 513.65 / DSM 816 / NCTC 3887 / NRRL 1 / QM 1276 / 107) TaxID=344612 RepID=A1CJK1_ASPCL|nr:radical SAM domain protein [Aspergillus clavatus NRRL 1]EAW09325.1 radical SAM domain protein [Aspergillus clavatus NRRL 1]
MVEYLISCIHRTKEYLLELVTTLWWAIIAIALSSLYREAIKDKLFGQLIRKNTTIIPVSVNLCFIRECNFECGSFHTQKTSHLKSYEQIQRGLRLLRDAGMKKIQFTGGEPLLYPQLLSKMVEYCKADLKLESVSILTDGSKLTKRFMIRSAKYLDFIAVSCDSFDEGANVHIGRGTRAHVADVQDAARLCCKYGVKLEIRTEISRYNFEDDMAVHIMALQPSRWRVFRVPIREGRHILNKPVHDARRFQITVLEFQQFCARHSHLDCFVSEAHGNTDAPSLLVDEYFRFLNRGTGDSTESILDVGVERALKTVYWV